MQMPKQVTIVAYGHKNIRASHSTTWQVTKEFEITEKADCIIGVQANYSTLTIPEWLKEHLKKSGKIQISLKIGQRVFNSHAQGNENLILDDEVDMVFRKSTFISPRTIALNSTFVAKDLDEVSREALKNPLTKLEITIIKMI